MLKKKQKSWNIPPVEANNKNSIWRGKNKTTFKNRFGLNTEEKFAKPEKRRKRGEDLAPPFLSLHHYHRVSTAQNQVRERKRKIHLQPQLDRQNSEERIVAPKKRVKAEKGEGEIGGKIIKGHTFHGHSTNLGGKSELPPLSCGG